MSRVEDARKLMQDFVAPEPRALTARLDGADRLSAERRAALLEKAGESAKRGFAAD